jgi:S-methylmethionine-dependent homocysteine/selenocysteine methylase
MRHYDAHTEMARRFDAGAILETPTWRGSTDRDARLGRDAATLIVANRQVVALVDDVRRRHEREQPPVVLSGCVGPRAGTYGSTTTMTADEAQRYHQTQTELLAESGVDMITALSMNNPDEAIGVVRAAREVGLPVVVSFTVQTDGSLRTGETLPAAIQRVDLATGSYPAYFMIDCAHPTHFMHVLAAREAWVARIHGLRVNASPQPGAEMNDARGPERGDPVTLGRQLAMLTSVLPDLNVLGGCCGTDLEHIEEIARACAPIVRKPGDVKRVTE